MDFDLSAEKVTRRPLRLAADICVCTNANIVLESLDGAG